MSLQRIDTTAEHRIEQESEPRPERPKRAATFLGRITQALREQNWVAVVIGIVEMGVVIGFQVTAWGQARADAIQEQTYLRQLVADLDQTERAMNGANQATAKFRHAGRRLAQAYYLPETPSYCGPPRLL